MKVKYTQVYRCDICSEVFEELEELREHFEDEHPEDNTEKLKILMEKLNLEVLKHDKYYFSLSALGAFNKIREIYSANCEEYGKYCKDNKLNNLTEALNVLIKTYENEDKIVYKHDLEVKKIKDKIFTKGE